MFFLRQNKDIGICYPPLSDGKLTAVDSVVDSESAEKEEDIVEETDHSTSRHSLKHGRSEDEEVTSKHTSSTDLKLEDVDPKLALDVAPISARPPKKPRNDTWDLDEVLGDDDNSE